MLQQSSITSQDLILYHTFIDMFMVYHWFSDFETHKWNTQT